MDAVDVIVTAKKSSRDATKLKELTHKVAPKIIREQLSAYLKTMREGTWVCCFIIFVDAVIVCNVYVAASSTYWIATVLL